MEKHSRVCLRAAKAQFSSTDVLCVSQTPYVANEPPENDAGLSTTKQFHSQRLQKARLLKCTHVGLLRIAGHLCEVKVSKAENGEL